MIYIPLCFYLILLAALLPAVLFYLHSTMLLLNLCPHSAAFSAVCIYIPLCFYLIICHGSAFILIIQIYIPLCFYLIILQVVMILQRYYLHSTMLLLNRYTDGDTEMIIYHLHSTMLLLNLVRPTDSIAPITHLHSTMLLLNRSLFEASGSRGTFTFHYAST